MHNGNLVCNDIVTKANSTIISNETNSNKDFVNSDNNELVLHYDSKLFGYLKLEEQENLPKRKLVIKTITYIEKSLAVHVQCDLNKADKVELEEDRDYYKLYNTLGHLHLLIGEYSKSLSAYQRFYALNSSSYKESSFLYGIGIVYFHYNNFKWAKKAFLELLYLDPSFKCSGEVHVYLGLIFIECNDFTSSIKHFEKSYIDNNPCSVSKYEIQFHIAHVYVLQNDITAAQNLYEKLLNDSDLPPYIRAHVLQQLGWILQTEENNTNDTKSTAAIQLLQKSLETDPSSGQSWYFLGRCFSSIGKVHDAFVSYRHSIDKSEASADTWCSIGVLYQQQSQPMDALQAYICAVQLRRDHPAAWTDLGVLYESCNQIDDALTCYKNAASTSKRINSQSSAERAVIDNRVKVLQQQLNATQSNKRVKTLPSIDEAWSLPIPAELTSRQSANNRQIKIHLQNQARLASLTAAGLAGGYLPKTLKADCKVEVKIEPDLETNANIKKEPPTLHQKQMLRYLQDNKETLDSEQKRIYDILNTQNKYHKPEEEMLDMDELLTKTGSEYEPATKNRRISLTLKPEEKVDVLDENLRFSEKEIEKVLSRNVFGHEHVSDHAVNSLHSLSGDTFNKARTAPVHLSKDQLNPSTPSVYTETKKEALSKRVQQYVVSQNICVVRGLATALKLDLGLFSTKSLMETTPQHQVEIRTQRHQAPGENKDENGENVWKCDSTRSFTTINNYANYQASTFQESLKDEQEKTRPIHDNESDSNSSAKIKKKHKILKFGTNVDLSDHVVWKSQLLEISKLPAWCRVVSAGNMLSHVGYDILGINTVQLYMKVPGSRTPGHQENLNFPAVNINIGPGDTEWFGVAESYWPLVAKLCERNGINFLKGSWWPCLEELYDNDIPVYRFVQKPGDLVWVGAGVVHWVQAVGWCNNIAWNVAPMTGEVLRMGADRYEYNRLCTYKSLVPLIHLAWKMADNLRGISPDLHTCIARILRQSLRKRRAILELVHSEDTVKVASTARLKDDFKLHPKQPDEPAHYCHSCEVEVYDILFVRELNNAHIVECVHCARKFTSSPGFKGYTVLAEHPLSVLTDAYRTFIDDLPPSTSTPTTTLATTTTTTTTTLDVKS